MAAGPWFTVREQDEGWKQLDRIWISNGETHEIAILEYRSTLLDAEDERGGVVALHDEGEARP